MRGREIMVRDARHKLVVHEGGFREFYDLDNDPNELKNLFGSAGTAEVERVFFDALAEWQLRHSPDLPQYKAMWP
jgi:hypothetical protein